MSKLSTGRIRTAVGLALVSAAAAVVAQSLHPDDRITASRNAAVAYGIAMDLATHTLAASCATYGGDAMTRTRSARELWTRRNGAWVDAAHRYLRTLQARVAQAEGEEAGRRFYEERKAQIQAESDRELRRIFPPDADAFATCRRIATILDARELDLTADAAHAAELRAIAVEWPAPPAPDGT
jgi:hypothetical protein